MKLPSTILLFVCLAVSGGAYAQSGQSANTGPVALHPPVSLLPAAARNGEPAKAIARPSRPVTRADGVVKADRSIAQR